MTASEAVDLALVRVTISDFESRAAGMLDGEPVAAEAGDLARAAGLLRTLLAALDERTRERDIHASLAEKYARESGKMEAQRDMARARADRLQATVDGLVAKVEGERDRWVERCRESARTEDARDAAEVAVVRFAANVLTILRGQHGG